MLAIDLHLVSWNRPKMTELVIRTIHRNTKPGNFRLIVWDNASHEDTQQMLGEMHDNGLIDNVVFSNNNYGLEFARQELLLHYAESDYFICIDNDCLPPPQKEGQDWIERLVELMQRFEDVAAISCRTQVMIGSGNIFDGHEDEDIVDFPHPGGSLRIMDTQAVMNVGGWDRGDPGRGAEERYICGKLREWGYKTAFAVQIRTLHLFGTRGDNPTDRWGYDKDLRPEETGHNDISHPALTNGDDPEEVCLYAGSELTKEYFDGVRSNTG